MTNPSATITSHASEAIAIFDFDGTLTRGDTFLPFLKFVVGPIRYYWGLFLLSPILMGYGLGIVPNRWTKEVVLWYFLRGLSEAQLLTLGEQFAHQEIDQYLRPEAVACLRWHQQQGHKTMLVSASIEPYILPWATLMGFNLAAGTRVEFKNDKLTGKVAGENCYGPEKVERIKQALGDLSGATVYAYGDSKGDRELLAIAQHAFYRTFPPAEELATSGAVAPQSTANVAEQSVES